MKPEFLSFSSDSRTAWVTLKENTSIAKVDLRNKVVEEIFSTGLKKYDGGFSPSELIHRPVGTISFTNWPAYGLYHSELTTSLNAEINYEEEESSVESGMKNVSRSPFRFTNLEGETTGMDDEKI